MLQQSFVTASHPLILPDVQSLQTTTTTSTTWNLLNYGAIPTEKWGWIDFSIGLTLGLYFPLRDHLQNDCFSGILHTSTLLLDVSKTFDNQPVTELDWVQFGLEPLFAALHFAQAFDTCLISAGFFTEYSQIVDQYFPNWGFELLEPPADEDAEDKATEAPVKEPKKKPTGATKLQSQLARQGKEKRAENKPKSEPASTVEVSIDYGDATKFFLESELEVGYSEILAYVSIGISFLEAVWAGWKVWSTFQSKYYFFELGNYLGRVVSNLFVFFSWILSFNPILAQRRIQSTIMMQGTDRPTSLDKDVIVVTVEKEPLKPSDDVFVDDQQFYAW